MINASDRTGHITATEELVEEGRIVVTPKFAEYVQVIGGTALLSEDRVPKASMGFLSFKIHRTSLRLSHERRPILVSMNGGPIAPSTTGNAFSLTGPYYVYHKPDGHLTELDDAHNGIAINPHSPVWSCEAAVHVDPSGTGVGRTREGTDPDWSYNSKTDAEAIAALIEWYCATFHGNNRSIILVGSSFAARRLPLVAIALAQRGLRVSGMAIVSGSYDRGVTPVNFDECESPVPFVNALPTLAACAQYHTRKNPYLETKFPAEMSDEAVFDAVRPFAETTYAQLLESDLTSTRRYAAAKELARITGLNTELIYDHELLISPKLFVDNLLKNEHKAVSFIDGRLAFPAGDYQIDPTLDRWQNLYIQAYTNLIMAAGFSKPFYQKDYQGILGVPDWKHNGLVANGRAHDAMALAFSHNPGMAVLAFNGYYDPNTPAPSTETFGRQMHEAYGIPFQCFRMNSRPFSHTLQRYAGFSSYTLPMAHTLTRPHHYDPRYVVTDAIRTMARRHSPS